MAAGKNCHRHQHAEEAAVERHAAFPDGQDFQRMGGVVGRLIKQHLAQSPARYHAQHAVKQQIIQKFFIGVGQARQAFATQPNE